MAGLVVVGAGTGIGQSVAYRFAKEGMPVGLIARSSETLDSVERALAPTGAAVFKAQADVSDESSLRGALDDARDALGPPEVVVYNAALVRADGIGDLSVAEHQAAWAVNVVGALKTAAYVAPGMESRGGGTIVVTGGMPKGDERHVSLSLGKAGVRALVSMLADQYGPSGVHVATVTVAGAVAPGTAFDPDDIAEHYWHLHNQRREEWSTEIVHSG
ncbi:SDR family NAD(P)-dependent oxidoreductase [Solicola gregarius]|uniref:SDR family NAD(P)-dependent oxidoreductase n=1 Tax=Solicola gregarius TaxID=2908642 RepID=A0AA46YKJ6_9ACTN|nr:SDR family NAD(P)-dependent oxidoreductase [Solicola gregarius]UYM05577.1 SDR family NAD(P)-dependent oxidoreductase [Solicola gregarius]